MDDLNKDGVVNREDAPTLSQICLNKALSAQESVGLVFTVLMRRTGLSFMLM